MAEHRAQAGSYEYNPAYYGVENIVIRDVCKGASRKPRRVLDVGCNKGYFGEKLSECLPDTECYGIEIDEESARKAAMVYKSVRQGDLNLIRVSGLSFPKFDAVFFLDVLEHLVDPQAVLKDVKHVLDSHAVVYVSLPNVAHFTIRWALLFGMFNYGEAGILDRTHLHLYTAKSARRLLESAGFEIVDRFYASNGFGWMIEKLPFLGPLLGFNLIIKAVSRSGER